MLSLMSYHGIDLLPAVQSMKYSWMHAEHLQRVRCGEVLLLSPKYVLKRKLLST